MSTDVLDLREKLSLERDAHRQDVLRLERIARRRFAAGLLLGWTVGFVVIFGYWWTR
jgi:hypothetical protein